MPVAAKHNILVAAIEGAGGNAAVEDLRSESPVRRSSFGAQQRPATGRNEARPQQMAFGQQKVGRLIANGAQLSAPAAIGENWPARRAVR